LNEVETEKCASSRSKQLPYFNKKPLILAKVG